MCIPRIPAALCSLICCPSFRAIYLPSPRFYARRRTIATRRSRSSSAWILVTRSMSRKPRLGGSEAEPALVHEEGAVQGGDLLRKTMVGGTTEALRARSLLRSTWVGLHRSECYLIYAHLIDFAASPSSQASGGCRHDSSLGLLTKNFLSLLESGNGTLDRNTAADTLKVGQGTPLLSPQHISMDPSRSHGMHGLRMAFCMAIPTSFPCMHGRWGPFMPPSGGRRYPSQPASDRHR